MNADNSFMTTEAKHEGWHTCSLVIGILAYLLLLIKSLVWSVFFGHFGFTDSFPQCIAANEIEQPLNLLN